jgi:hypothetical protein
MSGSTGRSFAVSGRPGTSSIVTPGQGKVVTASLGRLGDAGFVNCVQQGTGSSRNFPSAGATVVGVLMSVAALLFDRRAFITRTRPSFLRGLWAYLERLLGRPTRDAMRSVF